MHRFRHIGSAKIPVDGIAYEGDVWRSNLRKPQEHFVECRIGMKLVVVIGALPEAAPAAPDIPVRQVLNEADKGANGLLQVVHIHGPDNPLIQGFERTQDPAVKPVRASRGELLLRLPVVGAGIHDEKAVGIPPWKEKVAEGVPHTLLAEAQVFGPHDRG